MKPLRPSLTLVLAGAALSASAQNLVRNPSFEQRPFVGYSVVGAVVESDTATGPSGTLAARDGIIQAVGAFDGATGSISQALSTASGTRYLVSFDLGHITTSSIGEASTSTALVSFDGQTLLSIASSPGFGYQRFTYEATALTGSPPLSFAFTRGAGPVTGVFAIDNLSVVPVPEPVPAAVLGLGALSLLRRFRKP